MRFKSLFALLLLILTLATPFFCMERGIFRGRGRCGGGQCMQPAPAPEYVAPQAAIAEECNCCPACSCGENCQCSQGKPCCDDCRCLLASSKSAVCGATPAVDPVAHPGVIADKMHQHGNRYRINDHDVSRREAFAAVTTVPDDRAKLSLTFAGGTEAERKAAVETAAAIGLTRDCLVQALPAESPLLKKGFVTTGHPTVYLQAPDGKPLIRRPDASLESLQLVAAQVAAYDPSKDATGDGFTLADLEKRVAAIPTWLWLVGGAIVVLILHNRQTPTGPHPLVVA